MNNNTAGINSGEDSNIPTTVDTTTATNNNDDLVFACWMACCLTKQSTYKAFQKRKRSMTAPDVLEEIGDVVDIVTSSTIQY